MILEIVLNDRPSRSEVRNTQQYLLSLHSCAHVGHAIERVRLGYAALTEVIQQYKCAVLLVHHTGHSEAAKHRARGASELPAAVDHEFRVEPYDEEGMLVGTLFTNTKSKDTALIEPVVFDMINVGLGVCDEDMVEIETLVPELRGPVREAVVDPLNPITVVVDEDRKLRRKGEVKKTELVNEVWLVLDGTKKQAQRWVRRAIERGEIDDFPRT